ncbi:MAG: ComEC/Rec2 family competence protein [Caulobacteraceae bacterium]|nr:ComEC/Rec2 family competence protein [Caulobacteraceae bacterium]
MAFGCGCGLYFGLPREPLAALLAGIAATLILAAFGLRRWGRAPVAAGVVLMLAFGAAGTLAAKIQTIDLAGPVAPALAGVTVEGWVVDVASRGATGPRLLVAPVYIRGLRSAQLPKRVRVTVKEDGVVGPGTPVRFVALLNPPPSPASPGAFDFARSAYFIGVGGVGLALKPPEVIDLPRPPWRLALQLEINRARWGLTRRIIDAMGQPAGGIAAAMITGHDYSIAQDSTNEMRNAGISHILSISGVHMAIVGGFVFFAARLLIAAWPWLAVRVSGKKWAAVAGLAAVLIYLVVSGWPPPAQRSAVTAAVAFGAILLDRRAISLRGLGLSALIVLLLQPEAVVEPGFQMSYAATAALVALAEVWPHPRRPINTPLALRLLQRAKDWLVAGVAVGVVAGSATAPFAIQHFNRVSVYGLVANLLLEPLSSFVIMPALALGAVLQLFGLGGPLLALAGWGIEQMLGLAHMAAAAPGAMRTVASAPNIALPVAFIGVLWLCLWRGPLRWLGLPLALAVNLWPRPPTPTIWAASNGANAAVYAGTHPVLLRPGASLFAAQLWMRRYGYEMPAGADPDHDRLFACDRRSCTPQADAPVRLALWAGTKPPKADVFQRLCASAEVLMLRSPLGEGQSCPAATVLTGQDFARGGAVEMWRAGSGWRYRWTEDERGRRPWTAGPSDSDG